ncbi:MAG: T9SS type A sorting domain-containing protein [Flavobacteriaceae bacterium]
MGGSDQDTFFDMKLDNNNDVIVVGWSSSMGDIVINGTVIIPGGGPDFTSRGIIAKFSGADGSLTWVKHWYAAEFTTANPVRVAVDDTGNIYAGGYFGGPFQIDGINFTHNFPFGDNLFIIKMDTDGTIIWNNQFDGQQQGTYGFIRSMAWSTNGLYVSFDYGASYLLDGVAIPYSGTGYLMCTAKLNLGTGAVEDFFTYGSESSSQSQTASAIDSEGNLIIGGYFTEGTAMDIQGTILNGIGSSDGFIAKFNPDLDLIWAKEMGGDYQDRVFNIFINPENKIFVGGGFDSFTNFSYDGMDVINSQSPNSLSMFQLHLDSDGSFNQVMALHGYDQNTIMSNNGTVVLENGDVYSVGRFTNQAQFIENGPIEDATDHTRGFFMKWDNAFTLGVNDIILNENASVYPNPFNDIININTHHNVDVNVVIYDTTGKIVYACPKLVNNTIELNALQSGVYFLKLNGKDFSKTVKLVRK